MYESYWQLSKPAFENDADPEFYFAAASHHGALLKLRYLIENRKELGVLVGDHGLGKTFLTHVLERHLDATHAPCVHLLFSALAPAEMLRYLAARLGAGAGVSDGPGTPADVVLRGLEARLDELRQRGQRPVIVIDDAHWLDLPHLQTLQLLLNVLQRGAGGSMLLVGRPELLPRLRRLPALADRVSVRTTLRPLSAEESRQYVRHRLQVAGNGAALLGSEALRAAWELSEGIPRKLNQLCDLSLLVGYADGLSSLSEVDVEAAAEELCSVSAD